MDKNEFSVRAILAGQAPSDAPVTVKGWVRTRRDSKAGISFVHLSDGSSFHPVQVVAPNTLPNYADEVLKLTAGCAVEATGTIVPSPAKGQPFEMQASAIKVIGWVEDPDTYPIQPKPHTMEFLREVAHLRPRTNVIAAATRVRHTLAQAIHRFFDDNGFFWVNTPIITASDAEGAGALFRVSTLDLANLPRTPQGPGGFRAGFLRPRGVPDGVGAAQRGGVLPRAHQGLHVRADVPRGELEHQPPPRRVLDDRAGDRVRRPLGRCDAGGRAAEVHLRDAAEGTAGGSRLLRRADREGAGGEARGDRRLRVRAHGLRRGDRGARAGEGEVRVPGEVGHRPAVGARALSHREARQEAGDRDELPEGHQGVLHAA